MRLKISFAWVYNITNLVGVALFGVGFGIIRLEYGLIAAGSVLILLNLYASRIIRGNQ